MLGTNDCRAERAFGLKTSSRRWRLDGFPAPGGASKTGAFRPNLGWPVALSCSSHSKKGSTHLQFYTLIPMSNWLASSSWTLTKSAGKLPSPLGLLAQHKLIIPIAEDRRKRAGLQCPLCSHQHQGRLLSGAGPSYRYAQALAKNRRHVYKNIGEPCFKKEVLLDIGVRYFPIGTATCFCSKTIKLAQTTLMNKKSMGWIRQLSCRLGEKEINGAFYLVARNIGKHLFNVKLTPCSPCVLLVPELYHSFQITHEVNFPGGLVPTGPLPDHRQTAFYQRAPLLNGMGTFSHDVPSLEHRRFRRLLCFMFHCQEHVRDAHCHRLCRQAQRLLHI